MTLTCGQECQKVAKILTHFTAQNAIPLPFLASALAIAIFTGENGVAIVRLPSQEWSAPCAILAQSPSTQISSGQETVLLFMSEQAVFSLIGRMPLVFNQTHSFAPGPLYSGAVGDVDVYAYVRYNNGFTPTELISGNAI